ncbi:hypothetical protein PR048_015132 [Dryococelus australis]|uniref:DDE Tnp4 domain-containing protein n=1 Tax=Dryococelus australis TaxID=614101 RepID=A0ABQ9HG49_9NEOP|nr:hypothetical protein PR048_015132 [Dryococelus australis]
MLFASSCQVTMNTARAGAAFILMYNFYKQNNSRMKLKRKARWWMKQLYRQRMQHGNILMRDLMIEVIEDEVQNFTRILTIGFAILSHWRLVYKLAISIPNVKTNYIKKIVPDVCDAIIEILKDYIKYPNLELEGPESENTVTVQALRLNHMYLLDPELELFMKTGQKLKMVYEFRKNLYPSFHMNHPCVVMRVPISAGINYTRVLHNNGKHIMLHAPINSGTEYYNYKHFFSIVFFVLVDADYNFLYIDVGCQGRISDGGVFKHTQLYAKLEEKSLKIPPPSILQIPYEILTRVLWKECPIIVYHEDAGDLRITMLLQPEKKIVLATAYLHNFLRRNTSSRQLYTPGDSRDTEVNGYVAEEMKSHLHCSLFELLHEEQQTMPKKNVCNLQDILLQMGQYHKTAIWLAPRHVRARQHGIDYVRQHGIEYARQHGFDYTRQLGINYVRQHGIEYARQHGIDYTWQHGIDYARKNGIDYARKHYGIDYARKNGIDYARKHVIDYARQHGFDYTRQLGINYVRQHGIEYARQHGIDYTWQHGIDYARKNGIDYARKHVIDYARQHGFDYTRQLGINYVGQHGIEYARQHCIDYARQYGIDYALQIDKYCRARQPRGEPLRRCQQLTRSAKTTVRCWERFHSISVLQFLFLLPSAEDCCWRRCVAVAWGEMGNRWKPKSVWQDRVWYPATPECDSVSPLRHLARYSRSIEARIHPLRVKCGNNEAALDCKDVGNGRAARNPPTSGIVWHIQRTVVAQKIELFKVGQKRLSRQRFISKGATVTQWIERFKWGHSVPVGRLTPPLQEVLPVASYCRGGDQTIARGVGVADGWLAARNRAYNATLKQCDQQLCLWSTS